MAKVTIQPVTIWVQGEQKTAESMNLTSIHDNLQTSAQFYYELCEADTITTDENDNDIITSGQVLTNGNLNMSGADYQEWGDQSGTGINEWACNWALTQLNLSSSATQNV